MAPKAKYATAEEMAVAQREISVRVLEEPAARSTTREGGVSRPCARRSTTARCEEVGILPTSPSRSLHQGAQAPTAGSPTPPVDGAVGKKQKGFSGADRLIVAVQDNGPGIVKEQVPKIFGKLLYGSKFHRLRMSRGQQGIGISAAALYSQLTTGQQATITSRTGKRSKPHRFRVGIDLAKNAPESRDVEIDAKEDVVQGTKVVLEIEGRYQKHGKSVDEYLKDRGREPARAVRLLDPDGTVTTHERASKAPTGRQGDQAASVRRRAGRAHQHDARQLEPHGQGVPPDGVLPGEPDKAAEILGHAGISEGTTPKTIARDQADRLYEGIRATHLMAPLTDCLVPIGEKLEDG